MIPAVGERILIVNGFANKHRERCATHQISYACTVLLTNLTAGELISDSIIRAENALDDWQSIFEAHQSNIRKFVELAA